MFSRCCPLRRNASLLHWRDCFWKVWLNNNEYDQTSPLIEAGEDCKCFPRSYCGQEWFSSNGPGLVFTYSSGLPKEKTFSYDKIITFTELCQNTEEKTFSSLADSLEAWIVHFLLRLRMRLVSDIIDCSLQVTHLMIHLYHLSPESNDYKHP